MRNKGYMENRQIEGNTEENFSNRGQGYMVYTFDEIGGNNEKNNRGQDGIHLHF